MIHKARLQHSKLKQDMKVQPLALRINQNYIKISMRHSRYRIQRIVLKHINTFLKQVDEEGIFIPISYGRMTVVAPKDLDKVSFTQSQYELPFNEMQYK